MQIQVQERGGPREEKSSAAPFWPPHVGGKTFSSYPEHAPPAAAAQGNAASENDNSVHGRPWIHAASSHSGPTRSVVGMNVT
jgi:hypothetical protein